MKLELALLLALRMNYIKTGLDLGEVTYYTSSLDKCQHQVSWVDQAYPLIVPTL